MYSPCAQKSESGSLHGLDLADHFRYNHVDSDLREDEGEGKPSLKFSPYPYFDMEGQKGKKPSEPSSASTCGF